MEAKYTKGNWVMDCTKKAIKNYPNHLPINSENGEQICLVNHTPGGINVHEYVANANLILASPKMVDALLKVVQTYNIGSKVNGMPSMTLALAEAICNAETVLKEATE